MGAGGMRPKRRVVRGTVAGMAMTNCILIAESVTSAAQLVTASAVLNILCWLVLIYAAWKLRRAAQNLSRAAQGMETRRAETEGLGAKHDSPVGNADAP